MARRRSFFTVMLQSEGHAKPGREIDEVQVVRLLIMRKLDGAVHFLAAKTERVIFVRITIGEGDVGGQSGERKRRDDDGDVEH